MSDVALGPLVRSTTHTTLVRSTTLTTIVIHIHQTQHILDPPLIYRHLKSFTFLFVTTPHFFDPPLTFTQVGMWRMVTRKDFSLTSWSHWLLPKSAPNTSKAATTTWADDSSRGYSNRSTTSSFRPTPGLSVWCNLRRQILKGDRHKTMWQKDVSSGEGLFCVVEILRRFFNEEIDFCNDW